MANELDPLVQEILLKGDDELLKAFQKIGKEGAEHIEHIAEAALNGASRLSVFGQAVSAIEVAISAATAATILFIEQQTELSQKTELLANAFGTTAGELLELEQIFASSGVKVEQFERFATRLTTTIAREWPSIAESIRTYATENDASTLRVTNAIIRVRDAQNRLADNSEQRAATIKKDNEAVEASYIKLQFAAQHALEAQVAGQNSVRSASLSTEAALQAQRAAHGDNPSDSEKQSLKQRQADQAVADARAREDQTRTAEQERQASAALKQQQLEQAHEDLRRKAAKDAREDNEQRIKDENAIKEAVIARAEAEEKETKFQLTNIVSIKNALKGLAEGNEGVAKSIDLNQVSVQNLTKAMFALAAETSKGVKPTGFEALATIAKELSNDTEHLIDKETRLALVTHLAGTSMQALGKSASEILDVIENDAQGIEHLKDAAHELDQSVNPEVIKNFRSALTQLQLALSVLSQQFAAAIAPGFTVFLQTVLGWVKELGKSAQDTTGFIHMFGEGLNQLWLIVKGGVTVIAVLVDAFVTGVAKAFNTDKATVWKAIIASILIIIAAVGVAWAAWPIIAGLVVLALGYIAENWEKIKKGAEAAWERVKDSTVYKFLDGIVQRLKDAYGWWQKMFGTSKATEAKGGSGGQNADGTSKSADNAYASGGEVNGPGSTTSDSIFARLSRGEFVVRAAAVQAYGAGLFHSLNNMSFPGFAAGGLVPAPVRMAGNGTIPATSVLNLSIDGRSFNGLRGPKSTIEDLSSFAISRQTSAAGSNPSWMK